MCEDQIHCHVDAGSGGTADSVGVVVLEEFCNFLPSLQA